jgi:hypothetical protein
MWNECLRRGDECRTRETVPASRNNFENRHRLSSVSSESFSQEIAMESYLGSHLTLSVASFRKMPRLSRLAFCTAPAVAALLSASSVLASQGPGGGPGTASSFTQLVMAIVVYGTSALVVGAGLIGMARRH